MPNRTHTGLIRNVMLPALGSLSFHAGFSGSPLAQRWEGELFLQTKKCITMMKYKELMVKTVKWESNEWLVKNFGSHTVSEDYRLGKIV